MPLGGPQHPVLGASCRSVLLGLDLWFLFSDKGEGTQVRGEGRSARDLEPAWERVLLKGSNLGTKGQESKVAWASSS